MSVSLVAAVLNYTLLIQESFLKHSLCLTHKDCQILRKIQYSRIHFNKIFVFMNWRFWTVIRTNMAPSYHFRLPSTDNIIYEIIFKNYYKKRGEINRDYYCAEGNTFQQLFVCWLRSYWGRLIKDSLQQSYNWQSSLRSSDERVSRISWWEVLCIIGETWHKRCSLVWSSLHLDKWMYFYSCP